MGFGNFIDNNDELLDDAHGSNYAMKRIAGSGDKHNVLSKKKKKKKKNRRRMASKSRANNRK